MKKTFLKALVFAMGISFFTAPIAKAADSSSVVLKPSGVDYEITIPEKYNFVFDGEKSYGDNIEEYGVHEDELINSMKGTGSHFQALYTDDYYFINSYDYYQKGDIKMGHLKDCSQKKIDDLSDEIAKAAKQAAGEGFDFENKGTYKSKQDDIYIQLSMIGKDATGDFKNACLCTIVNNDYYYFYTKSYNPDANLDNLFEDTKTLVDGVKFNYDDSIKSPSSGIDLNRVFRKACGGAVMGAMIGGAYSIVMKIKKKKESNTEDN
ncbi:MAG: hypothetical protein K6D38_05755 [Pseudobutyrivibrio sp.]|nr:hypothetical protein [Pseudobutyrivibrio sp.]